MEVGCTLCPRRCGVPRPQGFCGAHDDPEVAAVCIHRGEEQPLNPIVNIFFAHCNLQCIYCQNHQISLEFGIRNSELSVCGDTRCQPITDYIADRVCALLPGLSPSASSPLVGFVTAAHYVHSVPVIVEAIRRRGVTPTVVYNSSGYEIVEALRGLEGYVDIYLPDLKYMDSDLAARYSHAPDYPEVAAAALDEMRRQVGAGLKIGDDGVAYRGMLVRHLVLPGALDNTRRCLDHLADHFPTHIFHLSLMAQYYPPFEGLPSPLDRTITADEYAAAVDYAVRMGFDTIYTQQLTATDNYRPDFSRPTPF